VARTIDDVLAEARRRIDRLTPAQAAAEAAAGAVLVDTRDTGDRARDGTIEGSVHIPRTVLEWRADPSSDSSDPRIADPRVRLIIVCDEGYSSSLAAASLKDLGFERVADLEGGFVAWKAAGLPVID
jgi:rhodanese-related sulfurtransferase